MKNVEFVPTSRAELDATAERYEVNRPGRGERFYAAVERAVQLIREVPVVGPAYRGIRADRSSSLLSTGHRLAFACAARRRSLVLVADSEVAPAPCHH